MRQMKIEIFDIVTAFYRDYGVGMFGLTKRSGFRKTAQVPSAPDADYMNGTRATLIDPNNKYKRYAKRPVGYELQKQKLVGKYGGICRW